MLCFTVKLLSEIFIFLILSFLFQYKIWLNLKYFLLTRRLFVKIAKCFIKKHSVKHFPKLTNLYPSSFAHSHSLPSPLLLRFSPKPHPSLLFSTKNIANRWNLLQFFESNCGSHFMVVGRADGGWGVLENGKWWLNLLYSNSLNSWDN